MRISDWSSDVCSSDLATITIDRPEKRNAMSFAVLGEFHAAIARAADDEAARAVIITGAGGAFCAGTDLSNLADTPPDERSGRGRSEEHTSELQSLMRTSDAVFCLKKKKKQTSHQHN